MNANRTFRLAEARGPSQFGRNLRVLRLAHGLTQTALSTRCGISNIQLSHYETGVKQHASAHNLSRLADALRVSVDDLLTPAHYHP